MIESTNEASANNIEVEKDRGADQKRIEFVLGTVEEIRIIGMQR